MRRAFELRAKVTPYDAAYVALAGIVGCESWTAGQRFAKGPRPLPDPGPELTRLVTCWDIRAPMAAAGRLPLLSPQPGAAENCMSRAEVRLSNGAAAGNLKIRMSGGSSGKLRLPVPVRCLRVLV
jgi:hypothetical protein